MRRLLENYFLEVFLLFLFALIRVIYFDVEDTNMIPTAMAPALVRVSRPLFKEELILPLMESSMV